jgi:hypothetical protein
MSLELAQSWVTSAFRLPPAVQDALRVFETASAEGVDATLIVAPELTFSGKCCLAHWTGEELAVVELSPEQQQAFGIKPGTLYTDLEPRQEPQELPASRRIGLTDVRINDHLEHDSSHPLIGNFSFEAQNSLDVTGLRCALRVKYFRPEMPCRITCFSYVELVGRQGGLDFSFESLDSAHTPGAFQGPLVLIFQLVTARSWTMTDTWQRISNVLVRVIEVE